MDAIWHEIGIHWQHVAETSVPCRYQLICDKSWLQTLEKKRKISLFPVHNELDRRAHPVGDLEHPWVKVLIQLYKKCPNIKAYPLSNTNVSANSFDNAMPLSYSQSVSEVAQANFRNVWQKTYESFADANLPGGKDPKVVNQNSHKNTSSDVLPYDAVLKDLIQIIYKCPIIHCQLDRESDEHSTSTVEECKHEPHDNVLPALITIETSKSFVVIFYPPCIITTLYDCITYSPAILSKSYNKPLFIIYQILQFTKYLHQQGLILGNTSLQDIVMKDDLWIWIIPKLQDNIIVYEIVECITDLTNDNKSNAVMDVEQIFIWNSKQNSSESSFIKLDLNTGQFSLREYCELWCNGRLSNFDYLTVLNRTSGRSPNNPYYHPIMPWVTDFTARSGLNWRDLTKSKYRLCKGDAHLDVIYSQASMLSTVAREDGPSSTINNQVPHHVSDFLSEITYFAYMARRTPQHILREHVRPIWVPAEYPASIQRLQEWTPDECIPEFYTNPMIFKSIHEDLPDLELPTWASCPEDFILKHREALESQYVSERLHHWIDLNFGYKLAGKAAIKSKNVCLSMVDQHKQIRQRGIVQLFMNPHPPKRLHTTWFNSTAPRVQNLLQKPRLGSVSKYLAKSSDNLHQHFESLDKSDNISTRSMGSNSPRLNNKYAQHKAAIADDSIFYNVTNFIELPKDYNPLALLQSYEAIYSFIAKTFPSQQIDNKAGETTNENCTNSKIKSLIKNKSKCLAKEMQSKTNTDLKVLGCLILEIFCMARLRPLLGPNVPLNTIEERLQACLIIQQKYKQEIPKCVLYTVSLLFDSKDTDIYTRKGLPPISVTHLLEPIYSNLLIPFPFHYYACYALIRSLKSYEFAANLLDLHTHFHCDGIQCSKYNVIDRIHALFQRKIAECKVMSCCTHLGSLLESQAYEQFPAIEILLPYIIELLTNEHTSILTAWTMLDTVGQCLGIIQTQRFLLHPILKLYDAENFERERNRLHSAYAETNVNGHLRFSASSSFKSQKSVKLYHHSFLLRLIIRFGLRCFLQNFIAPLIEAVSGYKEPEDSNSLHYHSSLPNYKNINENLIRKNEEMYDLSERLFNKTRKNSLESQTKENKESNFLETRSVNSDVHDVFSFDDEGNTDSHISDRISTKSLDSFDMRFATAEEAKEDEEGCIKTTPEKKAICEIFFGSNISNNSLEEADQSSSDIQHDKNISMKVGPCSPIIAIPTPIVKETCHDNVINSNIRSFKSIDKINIQDMTRLESEVEDKENMEQNRGTRNSDEKAHNNLNSLITSKAQVPESCENNRISEMSSESLIWLSHRLGPVLTCRFISKNLLKMLSLCYAGQENLLPTSNTKEELYNLNYFSISHARVVGDRNAARILECLMSIAGLYGERVILLQYFSHITEVISSITNRIGSSLEGAIISTLQLMKYLIPCLLDATIMDHLEDLFLSSVLVPMLKFLSSIDVYMPSGYLGRLVLSRKFLDAVYVLCTRIGADMTHEHLCLPIIRPFFQIFGKDFNHIPQLKDKLHEREDIRDVFSIDLARSAYLAFLPILGEDTMRDTLTNFEFIVTLCHEFEKPDYKAQDIPYNIGDIVDKPLHFSQNIQNNVRISNSFGTQIVGNRITVTAQSSDEYNAPIAITEDTSIKMDDKSLLDMIAYKFEHLSKTRHLKGNWLAYWRHEITIPDNGSLLNLKQIKLQSFVGHTNSVRTIFPLDNENSFISASKDKTIKLWSLRNEGDGTKQSYCQFSYTVHKKPIHSLSFLESLRLVVSCDSGVHIWDPFIGRPIKILSSGKHNPITVIKCLPSPSPLVLAGTAEASVKIIDARCMQYVNEWRINMNMQANATVRCMTVAPSGNWMAVGLSCGSIVTLDTRTGLIMNSWRPTECDVLQLGAPNEHQLISSALDHSLAVWNAQDSILQYQLIPPTEPAHYLQAIGSTLVYATTGNRIGIYSDLSNSHSFHSVTKLRSETFRGVLTSLAVLPLNRAFLAGNESGNISLFC